MHSLIKELLTLARNCSKNGFVINTHADVILIKENFGLTDLELCKVLGQMKYDGLLQEFKIQYSGNGRIYKYWFK